MTNPDLGPAARLTGSVVTGVTADALGSSTPCPAYTVSDLLAHLDGLSLAFTAAARREFGPLTDTAPGGADAPSLADGWRERIPGSLDALAAAWAEPEAWNGEMTRAGGVDLPGPVAGLVALTEVVLHGWDVAVATGQAYLPDDATVTAVHAYLTETRKGPVPEGLFGPEIHVSTAGTPFEQALGLAGRDPAWSYRAA